MKTTITLDETEIAEAVKMYVNKGGAGRGMNVIGNICVKVSGESLSSATVHAQVDVEPKIAQGKDGKLKGTELAQAWYELARWCESSQLPRSREECLRRALDADADHAATRTALGYVKLNDSWVTPSQKMQALGLVPYKDRWVDPQARAEAEKASQVVADAERASPKDRIST